MAALGPEDIATKVELGCSETCEGTSECSGQDGSRHQDGRSPRACFLDGVEVKSLRAAFEGGTGSACRSPKSRERERDFHRTGKETDRPNRRRNQVRSVEEVEHKLKQL